MTPEARRLALRALAAGLEGLDREAYATAGADPLEPVLGGGASGCRVCLFGRDPGRHEVRVGAPFVGAGGQKIRRVLHAVLAGGPPPDADAALAVGRHAFWANTVPYKPVGNKAWPARVRSAFRPLIADLLVHDWQGQEVLAFGREAFDWFADTPADAARFAAHWSLGDTRYVRSVQVDLVAPDGAARTLNVHPLPHPSPLNAAWAGRFAGLLEARLRALGYGAGGWHLGGGPAPGSV